MQHYTIPYDTKPNHTHQTTWYHQIVYHSLSLLYHSFHAIQYYTHDTSYHIIPYQIKSNQITATFAIPLLSIPLPISHHDKLTISCRTKLFGLNVLDNSLHTVRINLLPVVQTILRLKMWEGRQSYQYIYIYIYIYIYLRDHWDKLFRNQFHNETS